MINHTNNLTRDVMVSSHFKICTPEQMFLPKICILVQQKNLRTSHASQTMLHSLHLALEMEWYTSTELPTFQD